MTVPSLRWCRARLLDHASLVDRLGLAPDAADDAVVAAAVTRWGSDAPDRLLGAFAYARDDGPVVTITRDALGLMPAYWVRDADGEVHVSDVIAELYDLPGVDHTPDDLWLAADGVNLSGLLPERTAVLGVHRVPPGSTVVLTGGDAVVRRWWHPEAVPRVRRIAVADAAAQLRDLLRTVTDDHLAMVERRAPRGASVAAHCSGGLDSTAVAFLARDALARDDRRLSVVVSWSPDRTYEPTSTEQVEHHGFDERDLVEDLAAALGAPVWFAPPSMVEADWLAALAAAVVPRVTIERESWVAPEMAARGVTHVLSGWGGDEFASFNGRGVNRELVRRLRIGALRGAYRRRRARGLGRTRALWATLRPGLPVWFPGGKVEPAEYQRTRRTRVEEVKRRFPEFGAVISAHERRLGAPTGSRAAQLALLERGHLTRRTDAWHQVARRFAYEYGYPLLDRRVVEWALAMPSEVFREASHTRRVFRQAVAGVVPADITVGEKADPVLFDALQASRGAER